MASLYVHDRSEAGDISMWLDGHAGEPDMPRYMLGAAAWVDRRSNGMGKYPATFDIPPRYIHAIRYAIDDFAEVLAAHDECFNSHVMP